MKEMFQNLPIATKVFLLVNVALFIASEIFPFLKGVLALHYYGSDFFMPHQILTHIFMHSGLPHLFFNMYALFLFGSVIEKLLGTKKFIIFYFISAIGAIILQMAFTNYGLHEVPADILSKIQTEGAQALANGQNYSDEYLAAINAKFNGSMVGASGALMGLLMGFAILFPNVELQIIFIPIAIKAKYFVPIYMVIELVLGVGDFQWDNIAHFAHLGGAIFGGLLLFFWLKTGVVKRRNANH